MDLSFTTDGFHSTNSGVKSKEFRVWCLLDLLPSTLALCSSPSGLCALSLYWFTASVKEIYIQKHTHIKLYANLINNKQYKFTTMITGSQKLLLLKSPDSSLWPKSWLKARGKPGTPAFILSLFALSPFRAITVSSRKDKTDWQHLYEKGLKLCRSWRTDHP
jgi:hypothetical protein